MSRARTGKVARLPLAIREELCHRLRDGQDGPAVLAWVNKTRKLKGPAALTAQNLSEWRQGGYVDWLREQGRVDKIRSLSEFALRLAQASGGDITAGSAAIAGGKILELIESAEDEDLQKLIGALGELRSGELQAQRIQIDRAKVEQKDRALLLEEKKFQRTTAELFLRWYDQEKARRIADSRGGKEVKVEKLVQLMFGERPDDAGPQK